MNSITKKIDRGLADEKNEVLLHTGPHHDDISLGILPHITKQLHENTNKAHFAVLTSGFTAVTNSFVIDTLRETKKFLDAGLIQMVKYDDFFESGYNLKKDKDVYHYLANVASEKALERLRGDRKSTRLNSSHVRISYAVFCLKKKKKNNVDNAITKAMLIFYLFLSLFTACNCLSYNRFSYVNCILYQSHRPSHSLPPATALFH